MEDWRQRTELLIGKSGIERLENASVLVVGLGGVGGMAAEMICRAGVGNLTIVDCDTVNVTNINRQIIALHNTLEQPKAKVLGERLLQINPDLKLTVLNELLDSENTEQLLDGNNFDFVVDAIDTLSPKVFLIKACIDRGIKIVSSMGSGGKVDPSKIKITDISKTEVCALARAVRQRLRKIGIKKGLPVVFSTEPANKEAIVETDERYKKSTTGTISYLPAVFGCYLASYVIRELTD
ncbi:tRNA threonylcarbamoyladenosine dehydratase [Paludibacter sp. 221]|uniref:tRNA threonylcarbamoyladenosine dehydratase n=1 Tax=Paludibacter sp. 221 TaxID=2302939 RepID=UPI0013D5183B|nr:tRNA threonylcarbamoyladenosine dehydratase [Paludibacter sp. 221]NDV46412.1 tRNA threonylcarbamoyladenosine dehydratase [Paludibacter sp. 221]